MRENIAIEFLRKNKPRAQLFAEIKNEPTIIYAATRSKTEVLARAIRDQGWDATHYHAGLENDDRRAIEQAFLTGEVPIIVATNAFGMGIDHGGIRKIIHADMPASLEAYVQEIGRAGRDGQAARAIMLFGEDDYEIRKDQIETSVNEENQRAQQTALLDALYELANRGAGWPEINDYFLEDRVLEPCDERNDDVLSILKRWRYSQAQRLKIPPFWVVPDEVLANLADAHPTSIDALAKVNGMGETRLRKYGASLIEALGGLDIEAGKARRQIALQGHGDVFEKLTACARDLRYGIHGLDKPMDCSSALIARISKSRPSNLDALAQIQGMNTERLTRFGDAFLLVLNADTG